MDKGQKGLKELAGGSPGAALGTLLVVLSSQFGAVEWTGENAVLVVLAFQGIGGFIRPYLPKPKS